MRKYRSAIIGCGGRAYGHAAAYQHVHTAELIACANRSDAGRREKFAATFGITGYADAEQMLRSEQPDLVHLVAMPDQWPELISLVSALGVPACLVEKPIACNVTDWRFLCKLEAETATKFGVGKQYRWHPDFAKCREAVTQGKLGAIQLLDFSCGMNLTAQGTHIIDWAMCLNNDSPIVRVFGAVSGADSLSSDYPAPDTSACEVLFENGVRGFWRTGTAAPQALADDAVYKHCRVAVYGEKGHALFEEFGRWEVSTSTGTEQGVQTPESWRTKNDLAQAGLTQAMVDWLEDDARPVETNLKRALHQVQSIEGLYASALSHQPMELPFEPAPDLDSHLRETLTHPE